MIAVAVLFALQTSTTARPPTLDDVLARAGENVVECERQLAGLVMEERYLQTIRSLDLLSDGRFQSAAPERRRALVSDYLLVRPIGSSHWIEFRDVFEVDGKPVRDRTDRLARLFLEPVDDTADQVRRIVLESARYNLGNVLRTVNTPLLPLRFVDPANHAAFRFRRARSAAPPLPIPNAPADLWVIEYEEVQKNTFIKSGDRDLPAHGRLWIEPVTGRVRVTEMLTGDGNVNSRILVSYRMEPALGMLVPAEMRERYARVDGNGTVTGVAMYSRVRQFTVTVNEKLESVKK